MIAAAALSLASALLAAAASPGSATPAGAPALEVSARVRSAQGVNPACLREAVTGFLAGRGIPVHWPAANEPAPEPAPARLLSLVIDLTDPARAALTFTDGAGGSPQVRALALAHGLDQVACESLADVIEASVLAMAASAPAAAPLPPAPAPIPPPKPADADTPGALTPPAVYAAHPEGAFVGDRPAMAIGYTLQPVASDLLQSGIELGFGSRPGSLRRRNWLRLSYGLPVTASVDGASARWHSVSMASAASVCSRGRRAWFELGGGFGFDLTFVDTRTLNAAGSTVSDSQIHFTATFGADVTGAVRIGPSAVLYASLRLPFIAGQPVTLQPNNMTVFESWWMFRPVLAVGGRWQ
jgi:hypothetical protein